jgi:hypothetical protein
MTKITTEYLDMLDAEYGSMPSRAPIRGNTNPHGSLTDNLRMVKPNRDGAIRRARELKEKLR